jgi:hypothetical protein
MMIALALATYHLTPDGLGPAKIGMSRRQVERALHIRLKGEPIDNERNCIELTPAGPKQELWFMFQNYKLTRISVGRGSQIATPRGVGLGAAAAQVRRKYPGIRVEPHHYLGLPAEYLTYWTKLPDRRGVRFETDAKRRVETIHAGNGTIQLVEGCA